MKRIVLLLALAAMPLTTAAQTSSVRTDVQADDASSDARSPHYRLHFNSEGEPFVTAVNNTDRSLHSHQPIQSSQDYWDTLWAVRNYDYELDNAGIRAFAGDSTNFYIGGALEFVGNVHSQGVIKYNRILRTWSALGNGLNGDIYTMVLHNGKLYVGGSFTYDGSGATLLNHLAVWDGNSWQPAGGGVNGNVTSIVFKGNDMYVGGYFKAVDPNGSNTTASYIAKYDGSTWDPLGSTFTDGVEAMIFVGDSLVVAGSFSDNVTGLLHVGYYYQNTWNPLGEGFSGTVFTLAQYHGEIIAGGEFTHRGDISATLSSIAHFDGTHWQPYTSGGETGTSDGQVYSLAVVGDSLYIGGVFAHIAGVDAHSIVRLHNNTFTPLGSGVYGFVEKIWQGIGGVYVGGSFQVAGGKQVGRYAKLLPGDVWDAAESVNPPYGGYIETSVNAVAVTPQYLFIGGSFTNLVGNVVNHIAAWDKKTRKWLSLSGGTDNYVSSIRVVGNTVYAAGNFSYAGDSVARHIAAYDLTNGRWHPLGSGLARVPNKIDANTTGVYAVNGYTTDGISYFNILGRWDGQKWNPIDSTITGYIDAITAKDSTVYIGGTFTHIGNGRFYRIAMHDATGWNELSPSGLNNEVLDILVAGNDVYATGNFSKSGTTNLYGIGHWDGSTWNDLAGGLSAPGRCLASDGTSLYVGGTFNSAGGVDGTNALAKWNGFAWSSLGGGATYNVYGLATDGASLYVGGGFTFVDSDFFSYRFAILHFGSLGVKENHSASSLSLQNYPNPFASSTKIEYDVATSSDVSIELDNVLGKKVMTVVNEHKVPGSYEAVVDASSLANGTYLCRYQANGLVEVKQIIVNK
jgi:hypothetical protein